MTLLCFCAICPTASPSCTDWPTSALPFSTKPEHSFTQGLSGGIYNDPRMPLMYAIRAEGIDL
jgi:hypothetical protein